MKVVYLCSDLAQCFNGCPCKVFFDHFSFFCSIMIAYMSSDVLSCPEAEWCISYIYFDDSLVKWYDFISEIIP